MSERQGVERPRAVGRYWGAGLVVALALLSAPSCGGSSTNSHGGETHWLGLCSEERTCDARFDCLCGVCTHECESDADCSSLDTTAVCARGEATDLSNTCGDDAVRRICVRPNQVGSSTSSGGSGGTTGSTGMGGQGGDGSTGGGGLGACAAEDASGVNTGDCEERAYVGWSGDFCEVHWGCSCDGPGCAELSETYEDCALEHRGCFENQVCNDERRAVRQALTQHKSCMNTSDCRSYFVGCGVTEDGCTGAVYSNDQLAASEMEILARSMTTCVAAFEEGDGCGLCERVAAPPECIEGRCVAANGELCALEQNALFWFLNENKACSSDGDCTIQTVGCGVTEDGCTGAVYLANGFDLEEFQTLRAELHACPTVDPSSCEICERLETPAACIDGRCQRAQ